MLRALPRRASALLALALLPACGGDGGNPAGPAAPPPPPPPPSIPSSNVSFGNHIQPLFTSSCATAGCHGANPAEGLDLRAGTAYGAIVNMPAMQNQAMDLIEPGNADNSYLIHKLQGTQAGAGGTGAQMPRGAPALSQANIDGFRAWVTEGAQDN